MEKKQKAYKDHMGFLHFTFQTNPSISHPPIMEKFTEHCASLCSSSSSSSSKKSRLNFAIVSTLLASICFLTLRFSPSFLTLLLLIPSFLFLAYKKSDSNRDPPISAVDHNLFDEKPQSTAEERSVKLIGEERSSDDESSSNGGLGSNGDFDHYLFDEKPPQRTAEERSAALIGEEHSSDDESSSNGGLGSSVDFDHHLFDKKPQRTAEQRSAALIGEERSSDDESSSNGGLGSNGDFDSDLWMCFDELAKNPPFSDDSSSDDDDSLIEIPLLPNSSAIRTDSSGESVRNLEMYLPDFVPDSVLKQGGFMKFLEEINEEDNLIEIDISRGLNRVSTACN